MSNNNIIKAQEIGNQYYENHLTVQKLENDIGFGVYHHGELVGKLHKENNRYRGEGYSVSWFPEGGDKSAFLGNAPSIPEAKKMIEDKLPEIKEDRENQRNRKKAIVSALPMYDMEFYPTPPSIAGSLLEGVDPLRVKTILEPSAGKGDLLECAVKRITQYRGKYGRYDRDSPECDVIEVDPNLQEILKGKNLRLVGDDFLSYYSRKHYDLIVMNPPFSNGDEHLLHALELCEMGGQIACILNAETLRNPYTNTRKLLIKKLRELNASIRYIHDGFKKAERKAKVDIALINVNVPSSFADSSIWDGLEKAAQQKMKGMQEKNALTTADNIERLLLEYGMLIEAGIKLIKIYGGLSPHLITSGNPRYGLPLVSLKIMDYSFTDPEDMSAAVNKFMECVRSRYWRELFDLPEVKAQMTTKMRSEFNNLLDSMKEYEFSEFNIREILKKIQAGLVKGVEEAIISCFDKLSDEHTYNENVQNDNIHYFNGWKTNKAHYVNMKCIIPTYGCFARGYKTDKYGRWQDNYEKIDVRTCYGVLEDLEKALNYLDKGETTSIDLENTLKMAELHDTSRNIDCKYFTVTFYKKGTCHIKFKDQKIVDRLNIAVGKLRAWLPPTYGKVNYKDMDAESQKVVDEFQGKEKYEEVFSNPMDYIIEPSGTLGLM